jgi:hypothetical protein
MRNGIAEQRLNDQLLFSKNANLVTAKLKRLCASNSLMSETNKG